MPKTQCSPRFSNVTAKLGLRFLEMDGLEIQRIRFQAASHFLHVPIQMHFLGHVSKPAVILYFVSCELGRTTRAILHPKVKKGLRTKIRSYLS